MQDPEDYYIDRLVQDVVNVVHELGYKTCVLVGHDWCALHLLKNKCQDHIRDEHCSRSTAALHHVHNISAPPIPLAIKASHEQGSVAASQIETAVFARSEPGLAFKTNIIGLNSYKFEYAQCMHAGVAKWHGQPQSCTQRQSSAL